MYKAIIDKIYIENYNKIYTEVITKIKRVVILCEYNIDKHSINIIWKMFKAQIQQI